MIKKTLIFLKHEFLEMLPPTIFFFVVFHIIVFTRALMEEQYGIAVSSSAAATIGALIVGKAILIADKLPIMNWFGQKRLIYNVAWRIVLYVLLVLLFQFIEELIPLISKDGGILMSSERLFEEIKWHKFWATLIIFVVFLAFYCLAKAVIDAFGRSELLNVFLSSGDSRSTGAL